MTQEEKAALIGLQKFMAAVGATPEEIETELTKSMRNDPSMTPELFQEIAEVLNFKNNRNMLMASEPPKVDLNKVATPKVAKNLSEELRALKFGRAKVEQDMLDNFLKVIERKNKELGTILRIKQRIDLAIQETLQLQNHDTRDWVVAALEDIKTDLSD